MAELRKCKECGKLFTPKGREQYCPDVHYRPCPVCGKPVIAKYLSDPARKCENCRGKKAPSAVMSFAKFMQADEPKKAEPNKVAEQKTQPQKQDVPAWMSRVETKDRPTVDSSIFCEVESGSVRMYIGNAYPNCFIPGHEYLLKVLKEEVGTYSVYGLQDLTTGEEDLTIFMPVSSQISYNRQFRRVKEAQ